MSDKIIVPDHVFFSITRSDANTYAVVARHARFDIQASLDVSEAVKEDLSRLTASMVALIVETLSGEVPACAHRS